MTAPSMTDLAARLKRTAEILGRGMADVLRESVNNGSLTSAQARSIARAAGIGGW